MCHSHASSARGEISLLVSKLRFLATDLRLHDEEVGQVLRLPPGRWPFSRSRAIRWQPDRWQEVRLRHFIEMLDLTLRMLGDEGALWLRTSNRALFGQSPIDVLVDRLEALPAIRKRMRDEFE